jgi:uncharacterized protein (DUF302 family)
MSARVLTLCSALLFAGVLTFAAAVRDTGDAAPAPYDDGIVRVKSAYSLNETIDRLKQDIAGKGLMFFALIDQSELAAKAGVKLRPSSLLIFGNPALGSLFITSNPVAGLDWPVRLLVFENDKGEVWTAYTDFAYIARRHHIADRAEAFDKAAMVIASVTSSVTPK